MPSLVNAAELFFCFQSVPLVHGVQLGLDRCLSAQIASPLFVVARCQQNMRSGCSQPLVNRFIWAFNRGRIGDDFPHQIDEINPSGDVSTILALAASC